MNIHYLNNWAIEISNFDLTAASSMDARKIAHHVIENMVVVIRDQTLTPADQIRFCNFIGCVQDTQSDRVKDLTVENGILRVTGEKNQNNEEGLFGHTSALDWHANQASNYERKPLIWLYGVRATEGSVTSWINNIESYKALPDDLKKEIQDIEITLGYKTGSYSSSKFFKEHHATDRPFKLVHTNKAGQTGLYFPFLQIFGMKGIEDRRFNEILERLQNHVLQDEFRYDHYWRDGDVVLSEQWLSIHKRWPFEGMEKRLLHRIAFDYSNIYE